MNHPVGRGLLYAAAFVVLLVPCLIVLGTISILLFRGGVHWLWLLIPCVAAAGLLLFRRKRPVKLVRFLAWFGVVVSSAAIVVVLVTALTQKEPPETRTVPLSDGSGRSVAVRNPDFTGTKSETTAFHGGTVTVYAEPGVSVLPAGAMTIAFLSYGGYLLASALCLLRFRLAAFETCLPVADSMIPQADNTDRERTLMKYSMMDEEDRRIAEHEKRVGRSH